MASPNKTTVIEDIASTTLENIIPVLVDNVFKSNPVFVRLWERENIMLDGGRDVRQPIIFGKMPRGFYRGLETFDTSRVKTKTSLIFDWKQVFVNITIDGLTDLQNSGASEVIDIVTSEMTTAELSIRDMLGFSLYRDGAVAFTDPDDSTQLWGAGKGLTGLEVAIDDGSNFAAYGGVTRSSGSEGAAVKGNLDATGGSLTLDLLQSRFGDATIEPEKPDLIITTQTLWNKIWARVQPQQRFPTGPGFDDVARAGFAAINFNGAAIVADSHIQSGRVYLLNTKFIKMIIHQDRNFTPTGWKVPTNQDARIQQILWAGELVVQSPRLSAQIRNVT